MSKILISFFAARLFQSSAYVEDVQAKLGSGTEIYT